MMRLEVAGVRIELIGDCLSTFNRFEPFVSGYHGDCDLKVCLNGCDFIDKPEGKVLLDDEIKWLAGMSGSRDTTIYACSRRDPLNELICKFHIDDNWSSASIDYLKDNRNVEEVVTTYIGSILFRNRFLFHQGIVMHAAAIEWEQKGILFTAPSETGKSTQAGLWESYMGASVLNDDCPGVRLQDSRPYICGTPWSGSTYKFKNSFAPLNAVVVLEQGQENTIRKVDKNKAASLLMPRCFLPYHDKNFMEIAINYVESIIAATPVYHLRCRPDREAVELVYKCIK